eukprot:Seg1375.3 transcript_id=Seg1375.3/GoldUCD/mRNA.D3Y31 product="hypothetical protein" protein_id=Seg1375.3/GoldUCD/D3Y31
MEKKGDIKFLICERADNDNSRNEANTSSDTEDANENANNADDADDAVILAVYSEDDPYWLFWYNGAADDLRLAGNDVDVPGFWLKKHGRKFRIDRQSVSNIKALNLIKDSRSTEILFFPVNSKEDIVTVPKEFNAMVLRNLCDYGFYN